ncbi:hypothetical protein CHELA41_24695 [Hyphomicrobiales bacterium]|nr:hypothetical protein CHELA41_24695 [Hyphomicrobiales bacterium]
MSLATWVGYTDGLGHVTYGRSVRAAVTGCILV